MNEFPHSMTPYIGHGLLALFGAIVHATKSYRDGNTKTIIDFLALVTMSSFSGVMFLLVGLEWFGTTSYLTGAMAGSGGYIGVEGMTIVINYLSKKFQ